MKLEIDPSFWQQGLKLDYKLGSNEVWLAQNIIGFEF